MDEKSAHHLGRHVRKIFRGSREAGGNKPFSYTDNGIMATIGRAKAIAEIKSRKLPPSSSSSPTGSRGWYS